MRAVWKGTIGFGAYAIPVKAYGAVTRRDSGLAEVHLTDGSRVRHKRFCEAEGIEIPPGEVGRGYPLPGGDMVVLGEDDLESLARATHSMNVLSFVPAEQVDPVYFTRSYYLEPEVAGTKAYVLLSEALQSTGRVVLVEVALRQRETLGVLRVADQLLILETMLWPEEVRAPDFPFRHEDVDVTEDEVRAAAELIEVLAEDFHPERYTDRYQAALDSLISAKVENGDVARPAEAEQNAGVTALLAALQAATPAESVNRARTAAGKAAAAVSRARAAVRGRLPSRSE